MIFCNTLHSALLKCPDCYRAMGRGGPGAQALLTWQRRRPHWGGGGWPVEARDRVELAELQGADGRLPPRIRIALGSAGPWDSPKVMMSSSEMPVLVGLVRRGHGLGIVSRRYLAGASEEVCMRKVVPPLYFSCGDDGADIHLHLKSFCDSWWQTPERQPQREHRGKGN